MVLERPESSGGNRLIVIVKQARSGSDKMLEQHNPRACSKHLLAAFVWFIPL